MHLSDSMRRDWDERARKNAFHYIASWRKDWDAASFFRSGEEDFQRFVEPALSTERWDPRDKVLLELGCGAGRMTRSFARRFRLVYAFDVSAEMLLRARTLLPEVSNVVWIQGSGVDLSGVESNSVDFVFSYLVLQHLPAERLVLHYIREMLRVLKRGGALLFQFNSAQMPTMNWKGRLAWGLVDVLWAIRLDRPSRAAASAFSLDPAMAGKSWRGVSVDAMRVMEVVQNRGVVYRLTGENTPMTWCFGVKSNRADDGN